MIPAAVDYVRPESLAEALAYLADDPEAMAIAGGQSLIPILRFRLAAPTRLVDIGRLEELAGIGVHAGALRIGARVTYRDLIESEEASRLQPLLGLVAAQVGDLQVRNTGTIAGGVAHADPGSDLPAACLAAEAVFQLQSAAGRRSVPARTFFQGAFETALEPGELLTAVEVPAAPDGAGTSYVKFPQPASGFALASAAVVLAGGADELTHAALAFSGVAEHAFLAPGVSDQVGRPADAAALAAAAEAALDDIEPLADMHADAEYRRHLATVAARRAIDQALADMGRTS